MDRKRKEKEEEGGEDDVGRVCPVGPPLSSQLPVLMLLLFFLRQTVI